MDGMSNIFLNSNGILRTYWHVNFSRHQMRTVWSKDALIN